MHATIDRGVGKPIACLAFAAMLAETGYSFF
jgi:hypothetical protein